MVAKYYCLRPTILGAIYWQLKLYTPEYSILWVGFIDYVDHGTETCGAAKITWADVVITMSESNPSL